MFRSNEEIQLLGEYINSNALKGLLQIELKLNGTETNVSLIGEDKGVSKDGEN